MSRRLCTSALFPYSRSSDLDVRQPRLGLFLGEIEDVRVALGELLFGLLAEGVMPDDPVSHVETDLAARDHAQIGCELIADRQVKAARGLERAVHRLHPLARPVKVFLDVLLVVVAVIQVADVERRIGEAQVGPFRGTLIQQLDRIALDNLIGLHHAGGIIEAARIDAHSALRWRQLLPTPPRYLLQTLLVRLLTRLWHHGTFLYPSARGGL